MSAFSSRVNWAKIFRPEAALPAAQLSVVWLSLAALNWTLFSQLQATALRNEHLPMAVRIGLVCSELMLLAVAVLLGGVVFRVVRDVIARTPRLARVILNTFGVATVIAIVALYGTAWAMFAGTQQFPNWDAVTFFLTNNVQLAQHVAHLDPWTMLGLPCLVTAAVAGLAILLRCLEHRSTRLLWTVNAVALAALGCAASQASLYDGGLPQGRRPVPDAAAGLVYSLDDLLVECRQERTGPLTSVWLESQAYLRGDSNKLPIDYGIPVFERPQIAIEQYVQGVDDNHKTWNVILVIVESLRSDQLTAGGSSREVMPNVESLAREGRVFVNHYCQASHSNYADMCPLSSHYPLRSPRPHVYPKHPTYPRVMVYDILQKLGYRTAVVSSQSEHWGKMINYLQTGGLDHFFHSDSFSGPTYVPRNDTGFEAFVKGGKRSGKIDDRYTIAEAMRWTGETNGQPFFMYLNLQSSHVPYETPADFPRRFSPAELPFTIRFNNFPPDQAELVKDVYADSLAYVDSQLGKLIAHLKDAGEWDRTVMIVTGDTGQAFYEHGFAAHANMLFDEAMRVPLVIRAPGLAPSVDERLCEHVDVPPTVLELLGLPAHPSFQGRSLLAAPDEDRAVYLVVQSPLARQVAVVQSGYKYLHDLDRNMSVLFDLRADPGETRNVMAEQPETAGSLATLLTTWRARQLAYYQNTSEHRNWYPPVLDTSR